MRVVFAPDPPANTDFEVGAKLRLRWVFLDDDAGTPVDPQTVTLEAREAYTAPVTYTYPAPQIARDDVGVYRADILMSTIGRCRYTAAGTAPPGSDFGQATFEAFVFNVD